MNVPRTSGPDRPDAATVLEPNRDDGEAWVRHVRRGEFDAAWQLSDRELSQPRPVDAFTRPRHLQRIWDGRPVDGRRVLVRCYHGLGDTIQFARFLPALAARAASVVVWAQPALLPLLDTIDAPLELLPLHDGVPDVVFDVDVEIMELAWLLRATPQTLPPRTPYLRVKADLLAVPVRSQRASSGGAAGGTRPGPRPRRPWHPWPTCRACASSPSIRHRQPKT